MQCRRHLYHYCSRRTVIAVILLLGLISLIWSYRHRHTMISASVKRMQVVEGSARSEPATTLAQHMVSPRNEQYATYVNNLRKCLDTTNLTNYFQREKLLSTAVTNVKYYSDILHELIPYQFSATLPNHCWNDDVELVIGSSSISGHIGRTQYNISLQDISSNKNTMLCVLRWLKNYPTKYFLPFSCIPIAGFPKCGSTNMYTLVTSHPAVSRPIQKEPLWWDGSEHFTNNSMKNALYMADYLANFESLVEKLSVTGTQKFGYSVDAATTTLYNIPTFSRQTNGIINVCFLPSVLPVVLPKVKFIVMLRNPVTYLYSHFWYSCTINHKPLPWDVASKGPDIFHDRVLKRIAPALQGSLWQNVGK